MPWSTTKNRPDDLPASGRRHFRLWNNKGIPLLTGIFALYMGIKISNAFHIRFHMARYETFEKCSILFKVKAREDFNHRNILNISRIKIWKQRRDWAKGGVFQRSRYMNRRPDALDLLAVIQIPNHNRDSRTFGNTVKSDLPATIICLSSFFFTMRMGILSSVV